MRRTNGANAASHAVDWSRPSRQCTSATRQGAARLPQAVAGAPGARARPDIPGHLASGLVNAQLTETYNGMTGPGAEQEPPVVAVATRRPGARGGDRWA